MPKVAIKCPLCGQVMDLTDDKYICRDNSTHVIPKSEWERYRYGDVNDDYILHRMKIRRGKMVRGK